MQNYYLTIQHNMCCYVFTEPKLIVTPKKANSPELL